MNRPSQWIAGFWMMVGILALTGCHGNSRLMGVQPTTGLKGFTAEAIATYYDLQQVRYLTRQEHYLDPAGQSLVIRAQEPDGAIEWVLTGEQFTGPAAETSPAWCDRRIAKLVLTAFRAASGLIDETGLTAGDPIKVDGQWYQPLVLPPKDWARIQLMKKQSDSRIDRIELTDSQTHEKFVSLAYNPVWIESYGKSVPTKIDIFQQADGPERIRVQFHYRAIQYRP